VPQFVLSKHDGEGKKSEIIPHSENKRKKQMIVNEFKCTKLLHGLKEKRVITTYLKILGRFSHIL
jgi:hypothetical protein